MWSGGLGAEAFDFVVLEAFEVALEPEPPARVIVVAFPGEDVGGHPIQEPPIVGCDHSAAGKVQQRVLQKAQPSTRIRGRDRWRLVTALVASPSASCQGYSLRRWRSSGTKSSRASTWVITVKVIRSWMEWSYRAPRIVPPASQARP